MPHPSDKEKEKEKGKDKEKKLSPLLEKVIMFLQKEDTLQKLHLFVLDPLLNHILERVFPYIVLTCVLFGLLLILAMCTFAVLLLQMRNASGGINVFRTPV
jgi:hypothetical protein